MHIHIYTCIRAESGSILSSSLILSDLFRPDTLLNALRQQTGRAVKRPIDSLKLVANWDLRLLPQTPLSLQVCYIIYMHDANNRQFFRRLKVYCYKGATLMETNYLMPMQMPLSSWLSPSATLHG